MNKSKRIGRMALCLIVSFVMIMTLIPRLPASMAFAAVGGPPPHTKKLTDNGDGTYTLSLDVVGESIKKPSNVNVTVILDVSGSMDERTGGYGSQTRMAAAQSAVNSLATSLYAYNTTDAPDTVEMALVTFSTTATISQQPTNSLTTFRNAVNRADPDGGTNWEDALQEAAGVNFGDDDQTFVIFVSDGNPTFRNTRGDYSQYFNSGYSRIDDWQYYNRYGVYGVGNDDYEETVRRCYNEAVDDAETLAQAVGTDNFFTIGAFGNVDRMQSLTTAAGAPASHYYSASNTTALNQAISDILAKIEMSGFADVDIEDGTTNRVVTSSGEIANLLEVDTDSFSYSRSGGSYGTGTEWADAPEATFTNGKVEWDLSDEGVLENGVKYTVTFDCYPSQTTYDTIAKLKNGDLEYDELDPEIKKYIVNNGNNSYSLRTNTNATLDYDDTRTENVDEEAVGYVNPDPVSTDAETLTAKKEWEGGDADVDELDITVLMDDEPFHTATISKPDWSTSSFISIGIIKNGKVLPGAEGHDFKFAELGGEQYHWELETPTVHPMLIDGVKTMLILVDEDHPAQSGAQTYTINNKTYYADTSAAGLTATNHRRSNLNLTKVVTGNKDDAPKDALFPFTLQVNNPKAPTEEPTNDPKHQSDYWLWFSIYDTNAGATVTDATVSGTGLVGPDSDGYYYLPSKNAVTVQMKDGWNLRFLNLPSGTTYSFAEGTMPAGFSFEESVLTTGEDSTFTPGKTTTGKIENTKTSYYVEFHNQYKLVDVTPGVIKSVTGADATEAFDFSISLKSGTAANVKMPDETTVTTSADIKKDTTEAKNFGNITFSAPGTYVFTVDETTTTTKPGWTYDASTKDITVVVTADNDGVLSAEVTGNNPVFTNSYDETTAAPSVTKKVEGWDATEAFTFSIALKEGTAANVKMPDETTVTTAANIKKDATEKLTFDDITFYAEGTYVFTIDETTTTQAQGWTYDASTKDVTVVVSKDNDGKLVATIQNDNPTFTNSYKALPVEAQIPVIKNVIPKGSSTTDIEGKFTFTLAAVTEGAPMPNPATITSGKDGVKVLFNKITFTEPGTYEYTVTESITGGGTDVNGITLETSDPRSISVTVKDDGSGKLIVDTNSGVVFNNPYKASSLDIVIPVKKTLQVPEGLTGPDITEGYTFTIADDPSDSVSSPLPETKSLKNPGPKGGEMSFGSEATGKITVTEPGTYKYIITESGTFQGVTNDADAASGKVVTVVVTDNKDGTMSYAINGEGEADDTTEFINVYDAEPVTASFPVQKILTIPADAEDAPTEWSYTINVAGTPAAASMTGTVTNAAPTTTFGPFTFNAPGKYTYTVTESGEIAGVVNDANATAGKEVTIEVEDGKEGKLVVKSISSTTESPLQFTNTYHETGITIPVTKQLKKVPETLEGPDITNQYTFTISGSTGAPLPETKSIKNSGGAMQFGPITFNEEGTYTYTVTESGTVAGVTNDSAKTVTVTVTRGEDGELKAELGEVKSFDFINTYEVEPTTASFPVTKMISKPEDAEGPADWTYTINVAGTPAAESMTGKVTKANPTTTFGPFTYTEPGTYEYTVTESGTVPGVTNEQGSKTVTVTVVDNKDGTLTATADSTTNKTLTFTNSYNYEGTEAVLQVKKTLEVPEGLKGPEDISKKFTFTLSAVTENAPMPTSNTVQNPDPDGGLAAFGAISYSKPGKYTYKIVESAGNVPGVTNDTSEQTVTVTIVDGSDGNLKVDSIVYSNGKANAEFVNKYNVKPTTVKFPVKKEVSVPEGLDGPKDWKYAINVTAKDGAPEAKTMTGEVTKAEPTVTFGDFTYTAPGTYVYEVTETGTIDGITNDTEATKTVTVSVVDNGDGTLTATATSTTEKPAKFVNTYNVEPTTASFPVQKILSVPEGLDGPETWSYKINVVPNDGAPVAETMEGTVTNENDTANFGPFTYTKPGTYTYTVSEAGTVTGVTNDPDAAGKTVTVKVVDNGDGTLTATASSTTDKKLQFTNTYGVTPATVKFPVKKNMVIPEGLTGPATWSYTINVAANSGAPVAQTMTGTVSNTKDTVTFGDFTFNAPGTYTYTVTETGTVAGVTNDSAATSGKVVTVKVVDNGDGSLTATADYTTDKPLEFTNTYHVDPTTASFPVTKEVVVPEGFAGPDDWEFTVNVAGTPAAETMTGKVTKAEPTVTFGDFTYTAPGEYTYKVTETGTVAGITNDEAATTGKTVTVNVVDNGNGTLTATPTSTEAKPLTFTNNYVVPPITASIPVEKILSVAEGLNAPSIKNKFTFTLTSAEGTPMPGTTSYTNPDADGGDMTFGDITFDKPGTYTYTVKETGEVAGVSAVGATEKTVEISVVDNKDGTMTATVNGGQKLQFTNEYKVGEATAEIPVNKILEVAEGLTPDSIEGKFTFTLTAADGTPMPKTTSFTNPDATGGKVTFGGEDDPITFTKPGTYTYTVTETGSADGVTNDKTASKTVTVVVTDNSDGTMTAVVNEGKELDFTNTYTVKPTKASFPVEKILEVPEGLNPDSIKNKFTFTLTAEDGTPMPKVTEYTNPDADGGTVTFGDIEYTEPGTYTYTVTETGEVEGITNDTTAAKTVTVTVVDNGNGTLTATPSSTDEKPLQFTNKYEVKPTTAKFPVKKVLEVPEGLTPNSIAQKFTFTVTAADGTPMPPVVALQNPDATGGTVTFGDIEYTAPGTYTYTVTESGSADGVTNDETLAKTVIVTVTDNGDGTLTAVPTSTDEKPLTFTNKYDVEPTTAKFPVQKIMEVPEYLDGPESWSYTINVEAQKGAPAADTMTGTVTDKADTVSFGDFTYEEPGTYTYKVTENGTYKGVTNDEAAASGKIVTVTVVDNGDGTLTATPDYTTDKPLQFTNKYDAPPVEVPTSAYLKKTVVQMPPKTDETEFKFTLQSTEEGAEPLEGTVKATKAGDYTIDFGKLTFDKPGTYTYTLTEVLDGLDGGWVVTGSPATVTIKVTDNKEGELVAEVTGATISNNFETVKVEGEKIWNDDEYFDENGEPIEGYERPDVTINLLADGEEIDEVVVTAKDNWKFSFVDLPKYKDHGTEIVYTITEDDVEAFEGEVVDYTVENTPQRLEEDQLNPTELTIKKVDAETGNVIPTGATFVLKQGDTEIEYTTGEDGTVVIPFEQGGNENGEYTLYEKESPEGYELTDKTYTIVVDKEFDHVEIKESLWTWFYNLVFNKDTKTLFDKDTQTLTVENPPIKTNIEAEKVWNDNDDKDGVRPDSITLTLTGTAGGEEVYRDVKTVTEGDDWKAEWNDLATYVDGNEVTFEMTEAKVKGYDTDDIVLEKGEDGNYSVIVKNNHQSEPKKEVFTGSSKQSVDGEMVEAGQELTYEITYVNTTGKTVEEVTITDKIPENTEFVEADNEGVFKNGKVTWKIYDVTDGEEVVVTVVVKVKDSANGQALKNKAVVNDGTNKYESNEVVNKTPVKHDPPVKKIVKGDTPKKADKFKFVLTPVSTTADAKMPMPEGSKGKKAYVEIKAGQKKEFGEITFTEPGTYVYKVKEVNTKIKNYTYDSSEYTLTYVLEDNDGDLEMTLTVTKNGKKYDHSVFKFTNIYDEPVKTGDTTQVLPYMMMFTAAVLGLILVFRRRKAVRK